MGAPRRAVNTKSLADWDRTERKADGTPKSGWAPLSNEFFNHLPRLLRGGVQWAFVMYAVRLTDGLEPERREDGWPEWTPWVFWADLAERCDTTVRTIQEEAHELAKRQGGALIAIQERRGQVRFRLLWQKWPNLQSYKDVPRPALEIVPAKDKEPAKLLEKPFTVKAGRKSRPIAIPGWEKEIAFQGGETDCAVSLFLESDSRLLVETAATGSEKNQQVEGSNGAENRSHSAGSFSKRSPKEKEKLPALSVPKEIVAAAAPFGLVDDTALLQLIADCQSYAEQCTIAEIAAEVTRVGESAPPRQKNIAWLICQQVPKYFNSTAYREGIKPGSRKPAESAMSARDKKVYDTMKLLRGDYSGIK